MTRNERVGLVGLLLLVALLVAFGAEPWLSGAFDNKGRSGRAASSAGDPETDLPAGSSAPRLEGRARRGDATSPPGSAPPPAPPVESEAQPEPESGATLTARIVRPAGMVMQLQLQIWDPALARWTPSGYGRRRGGPLSEEGPEVTDTFHGLGPGRYRLAEGTRGAISTTVEIRAGSQDARAVLDLSRAGLAIGRVSVPEGYRVEDARVEVVDTDAESPAGESRLSVASAEGIFASYVPGDRAVTLRVSHPLLAPDPVTGNVQVTGATTGLRLVLVAGAEVAFDLVATGLPGVRLRSPVPSESQAARLLVFEGEPEGEPLATAQLTRSKEPGVRTWRTGGLQPGPRTLWIDIPPAAPVVLRGVVLGSKPRDLGTLLAHAGSSLRVRIAGTDPENVPGIWVCARSPGTPSYTRGGLSSGEDEVVVPGLLAGRFDVTIRSAGRERVEQVIEVNGTHDVTLDLDLR